MADENIPGEGGNTEIPDAPKPSRKKLIIGVAVAVVVVAAVYLLSNTALFKGQIRLQEEEECYIPLEDIFEIDGQLVSRVTTVEYAAPTILTGEAVQDVPLSPVASQVVRNVPIPKDYIDRCLQGEDTAGENTIEEEIPVEVEVPEAADPVVEEELPVDENPEKPVIEEKPIIEEEVIDFEEREQPEEPVVIDLPEVEDNRREEPVNENPTPIEEDRTRDEFVLDEPEDEYQMCLDICMDESGNEGSCLSMCNLSEFFYVDPSKDISASVFRECFDNCLIQRRNATDDECVNVCELSPGFYAEIEANDDSDDESDGLEVANCISACKAQGGSACEATCSIKPDYYQ